MNKILLLIATLGFGFNALAQNKVYDGDGVYAKFYYNSSTSRASSFNISGKRAGADKLVWLSTTAVSSSATKNASGMPAVRYEVIDEQNVRYQFFITNNLSTIQVYKVNSSGNITMRWTLKERKTPAIQTLTFGGSYNVKFNYDKKNRKMTNLQFSSNSNPNVWNKFEIYDVETYSDGGYDGKLFTVKDGAGKKFTILYSDSFDYIVATPEGSRSGGATLNLKK